jgi:hypothetical protein
VTINYLGVQATNDALDSLDFAIRFCVWISGGAMRVLDY